MRTAAQRLVRYRCTGPQAADAISWYRCSPRSPEARVAPLLLIHGFACGKEDWGALPRMIAARSRREVLCFDNRGIGDSVVSTGPYTVTQMAEDALAVTDAAGVEKVNLLGISLGGVIAQTFAINYPARTNSLILGCTTPLGGKVPPPSAEFMRLCTAWVHAPEPNTSADVDEVLRIMLPGSLLKQQAGQLLLKQFKKAFLRTRRTAAGLQGQLAAVMRIEPTDRLREVVCPTLVITGDQDQVFHSANSEALANRMPHAELRIWHGAGHFWWAHRSAEAVDILSRFLLSADHEQWDPLLHAAPHAGAGCS